MSDKVHTYFTSRSHKTVSNSPVNEEDRDDNDDENGAQDDDNNAILRERLCEKIQQQLVT